MKIIDQNKSTQIITLLSNVFHSMTFSSLYDKTQEMHGELIEP